MIVVMKPGSTQEMIQRVAARIEEMGLKAHIIEGTHRTVIAAIGEKRNGEQQTLESFDEVEKVVPILAPYKVASVETKHEPTVVRVRKLVIGGGHVGVIAGPCSVESEEQIMATAQAVKKAVRYGIARRRVQAARPAPIPSRA